MKKNYLYPLLCLCLFWLLPACSDSEEEFTDYLTPVAGSESAFTQGLSFSESAMTQTITFEAGNTWTATLEGTDVSSWCQVNPTKGNAGKSTISISARKNDTEEQRNATLIITTGTINKRITIIQSAGEKKPIAEWTDITANPDTWDNQKRADISYQLLVYSFADSDGDKHGDLKGLINKLDYIDQMGVNAIWLNPCFASSFHDGGYDITDFYHVDPRFGSDSDLGTLIAESEEKVTVFVVCKYLLSLCVNNRPSTFRTETDVNYL